MAFSHLPPVRVELALWCILFGCANDADLWTDAFKLSYKDAGIEDRVRSILAQSEDPDGHEVPNPTKCDQSRSTHMVDVANAKLYETLTRLAFERLAPKTD